MIGVISVPLTDRDLCLMVPDHHTAAVEARHHPWFSGMQIHTLHPVGPSRQLPLDVQPQRLLREKEEKKKGRNMMSVEGF